MRVQTHTNDHAPDDSCDAVVAGREIMGFPEKLAEVMLKHDVLRHTLSCEVVYRGGLVMAARLDGLKPARPEAPPHLPWWFEKIVPKVDGTGFEVHTLVGVDLTHTPPSDFHTATADLTLNDGALPNIGSRTTSLWSRSSRSETGVPTRMSSSSQEG